MNQPKHFLSLWFNRSNDLSGMTNHGINSVLLAQSSSSFNDNFEVGSSGSELEVYLDSEMVPRMPLTLPQEPGFPTEVGITWVLPTAMA